MLVIGAHRDDLSAKKERIHVSNFTRGFFDNKLAIYLAIVNPTSPFEAIRIAKSETQLSKNKKPGSSTEPTVHYRRRRIRRTSLKKTSSVQPR